MLVKIFILVLPGEEFGHSPALIGVLAHPQVTASLLQLSNTP
jgi:hypothetical protein